MNKDSKILKNGIILRGKLSQFLLKTTAQMLLNVNQHRLRASRIELRIIMIFFKLWEKPRIGLTEMVSNEELNG